MSDSKPVPVLLMVRELGIGGCERDLTKIAIGLDRTRFQPYVGCFIPEGLRAGELHAHGIPVIPFKVPSLLSRAAVRSAFELGSFLKNRRIQVMHAFDIPADIFAVPIARLYGTPAVISSELSFRHLLNRASNRYLLRLSEKAAHKIVVNSAAVGRDLVENAGVIAAKVVLNHNGVDLNAFQPQPRLRKVFPDALLIVGTVCALRPEKRIDLLLDAFARIAKGKEGLRLVIVGSGSTLPALRQQAGTLGIAPLCHFEPSKSEVADWMRTLDVFVMSSDSESFPNALLEAMACGCSVVGSRVGGIPELVDAERNGLIFEPGSSDDLAGKLLRLIDDPESRLRFAAAALHTARHTFPIEAAVDRLQNLYTSMLAGRAT